MRLAARGLLTAVLLIFALALAPAASAKMGSGQSYGSRASRTYDRPMQRSTTPPPAPAAPAPSVAPAPATPPMMAPPPAGGFFSRNPFMAGLLGFGLGGLLFGHTGPMSPLGAGFGMLLQLVLLFFVIRWVLGLLRGGGAAPSGPRPVSVAPQSAARPPRVAIEFQPTDADKQAFGAILVGMQKAWSDGDLGAMRAMATPEVVSFLADDLAGNASRGVRNIVDEVQLLNGEVVEAWRENGREFVTAALTYAARDYTLSAANGVVVDGDPRQPGQSCEAWTFVRTPAGRWLLSAVERE